MGKCVDCGYLAVKNKETRQLEEAEASFRGVGHIPPSDSYKQSNRHEPQPICFVWAKDIRDEIFKRVGVTGKSQSVEGEVLAVINEEQGCGNKFTDWQQGFTPKEHREMIDRKEWRN